MATTVMQYFRDKANRLWEKTINEKNKEWYDAMKAAERMLEVWNHSMYPDEVKKEIENKELKDGYYWFIPEGYTTPRIAEIFQDEFVELEGVGADYIPEGKFIPIECPQI